MGSVFKFKQFVVDQGNCAMKINTDGVLLGGWATEANVSAVLDIGTGTGVIALMLAQRYPGAAVDAIEIDEVAAQQAAYNFEVAPFTNSMQVLEGSFEAYQDSDTRYDLIVSNPPFYTNALHNPDARKKLARHADAPFFEKLIAFVAAKLNDNGSFHCIVPTELADWMVATLLPMHQLFLQAELEIRSFAEEPVIRKILKIGKEEKRLQQDGLAIYAERGVYSEAYKTVLKPFFLAF
ncbi:tRNA1(Val) (adenine(37)-N6)-methyltransferase [Sphingobacterium sp. MYb382]|uniref:tRNA1(Val) (adenine(37)-N6)-methyltransferase n=1 Tax=Sphingobacterium sp. MYb382 TaxID=2745278 RepID=UPI0030A80431